MVDRDSGKCNQEIRKAMREVGITQWQIADELGCAESTVTRMLRHELAEEDKSAILAIIKAHAVTLF